MTNITRAAKTTFAMALLAAASFYAGWQTSAYQLSGAKRVPLRLNAAGSIYVPPGHSFAMVERDLTNQRFGPSDRVDILVRQQGQWQPLVLDVLVASEDWQTMVVIARHSEATLIRQARRLELPLRYRATLAPTQ